MGVAWAAVLLDVVSVTKPAMPTTSNSRTTGDANPFPDRSRTPVPVVKRYRPGCKGPSTEIATCTPLP